MLRLIEDGLLHPVTNAAQPEWIVPSNKDEPNPPPAGYVVSFTHFHEQGFRTPVSNFFHGLLHYHGIELQNLNPNSILQIMVFVALCEGYLGIKIVFLKTVRRGETVPVRIGNCVI
jgi:hypothetical protein